MSAQEKYLGCPEGFDEIRSLTDALNAKVIAQVNESQELLMLNNFAHESNERQFKKCIEERIADIAAWRWVLKDLTKRLDEAVSALQYEHKALRVVIERVQYELNKHSRDSSRPGALKPFTDVVEDTIIQEHDFLRDHKKKFESMVSDLENEIKAITKTKKRLDVDILAKGQAISVEEACVNIMTPSFKLECAKKKKKRASPINRWQNRCASLKIAGLKALGSAMVSRQQVRGARTHLSTAAQAFASRVDSALRRRLHTNKIKLQDLKWQREEAMKDYDSLDEELRETEMNLLQTMDLERVIESRLLDRRRRPSGEFIKDEVDRKLRDELARLRCFSKQLRVNLNRITSLQKNLTKSMSRIDSCAEDILQVISLDEERIQSRQGLSENTCPNASSKPSISADTKSAPKLPEGLTSISEEDEDDYPFDE